MFDIKFLLMKVCYIIYINKFYIRNEKIKLVLKNEITI